MVREPGMTLLEVLIAMAILSIGLMGTIPFVTTAMSGNVAARRTAEATLLIQEKIEEFRQITAYTTNPSSTLASLQDTNGSTADTLQATLTSCSPLVADACETISRSELRGSYTRFWNIADNTPEQNMKTIYVHVAWSEGVMTHHISAQTIIAAKDRRFY